MVAEARYLLKSRAMVIKIGATLEEAEQRIAAISPSPPMQRLLMKLIPGATLAQVCFDASSLVYSRVFGH